MRDLLFMVYVRANRQDEERVSRALPQSATKAGDIEVSQRSDKIKHALQQILTKILMI